MSGSPGTHTKAAPDTTVLADGFSCRTQTEAGSLAKPRHLAELV